MSALTESANGRNYPTQDLRDYDPINHASTAEAFGRVGAVAWAVFRRSNESLVLSFEAMNGNRTVLHVDSASERGGFEELVGALVLAIDPRATATYPEG